MRAVSAANFFGEGSVLRGRMEPHGWNANATQAAALVGERSRNSRRVISTPGPAYGGEGLTNVSFATHPLLDL